MDYNIVIYLHYLGIMSLMGSLLAEHLILQPKMGEKQIISLARIDLLYGIAALVVLATGLLRFLHYGKGMDYYLHNPVFHVKLTLFILMGILSIWPTVRFLKWRKQINKGLTPGITEKSVKNTLILIRIELALVVIIPFLAVLVARGVGA